MLDPSLRMMKKLEYPPPPWKSALEPVCMLLSLIRFSRADPEMRGWGTNCRKGTSLITRTFSRRYDLDNA